jgi:hypothetical protein
MDVAKILEPKKNNQTKGKLVRTHKFEWRSLKAKINELKEQQEKLSRKDPEFKIKRREISREIKRLVADMKIRQSQEQDELTAQENNNTFNSSSQVFTWSR